MTDVHTQPLIAEQGAIRVDPYSKQSSSDPSLASLPPSMARTVGAGSGDPNSPAANPDANGDGTLDAEELGHLQDAAANGDKESWDLLNALKLPLGIAAGAAALYGAARGGLALTDAVMKSRGSGIMGTTHNGPPTVDPSERIAGLLPGKGQDKLPAPAATPAITDTTGSRFNQAGPPSRPALEDMRTPYQKSGGKLPHASKSGDLLRKAAGAVRRMH